MPMLLRELPSQLQHMVQRLWAPQNLMVPQHLLVLQNRTVQHLLTPQNHMAQHLLTPQNLLMLLALRRVPLLIMTTSMQLAQLLQPQVPHMTIRYEPYKVQSARIEICHVLDQVVLKQMQNANVTWHCLKLREQTPFFSVPILLLFLDYFYVPQLRNDITQELLAGLMGRDQWYQFTCLILLHIFILYLLFLETEIVLVLNESRLQLHSFIFLFPGLHFISAI